MKKIFLFSVLVCIVLLSCGCTGIKGTYNEKLSTQYRWATFSTLNVNNADPFRQPPTGCFTTYKAYVSGNTVNMYFSTVPVDMHNESHFLKAFSLDENGVIDIGWSHANTSVMAEWNKLPKPLNGDSYYLYCNASALEHRGYNVIVYVKNQINGGTDTQYASVQSLGVFKNGVLSLYPIPYEQYSHP